MPNYLNRPVSSGFRNTYKEQFVPLPLEQFARAQAKSQATQDQYKAGLEAQDDANFKLRGIGEADNAKIKEIRDGFTEASKQLANVDLTKLENQEAAKRLVKNVSRDKDLETINYNYGQYQEYLKKRDALVDDNNYQDYNDTFKDQYEQYSKKGGYKSGMKLDPQVYKYMDTRPIKEEFFNNMGENGSDAIKQAGDVYYKDGWKGITSGQVNSRAKSAFDSYLGTNAAQQELREYNYLVKNKQVPKGMSAQEFIFKRFIDAGNERIHGISDTNRDAALNADKKAKKEEGPNLFAGSLTPETPSVLTGGRKVDFNDNGSIKGSGQGILSHFDKTGFSWDTIKNWYNDSSLNDDESKDLASIKIGAKLNGVSDKQFAEVFDKTSHTIIPKPLKGKDLEYTNKQFRDSGAGLWSSMNVMNLETGERDMNFVDAIKKLGEEKGVSVPDDPTKNAKKWNEVLDELGVRVTGATSPNYFTPKGVAITIGGNTFVADMTYGGKKLSNATQAEVDASNYDKIQKFGSTIEKDSKGNDVIYYKDIKTGKIAHKLLKDLKD